MRRSLRVALRMTLFTMVALGILYPATMTGLAAVIFPDTSKGSLLVRDGAVVGSRLIAQRFDSEPYFHPRPSAADYDAMKSGASNLAPTSRLLREQVVSGRAKILALERLDSTDAIPSDALTSSGSGLDPDISPANARMQIPRIARARALTEQSVQRLVESHIQERQLGVLGEPRVNVLQLNLSLDALSSGRR